MPARLLGLAQWPGQVELSMLFGLHEVSVIQTKVEGEFYIAKAVTRIVELELNLCSSTLAARLCGEGE